MLVPATAILSAASSTGPAPAASPSISPASTSIQTPRLSPPRPRPSSEIQWVTADILTFSPPQPPHLVVSSLFAHHLAEAQIVQFLRWMESHAQLGWFINDLSRAPIPYHVFRAFSRLMRFHHFVQNDGPVSVTRAFIPADWQRLCAAAGLTPNQFEIQPFKPARLCVARTKTP